METKAILEVVRTRVKYVFYILKDRECTPLFVTMDTSCKQYLKRDNISQLRTSNSLVDYQLPCPPLMFQRQGKCISGTDLLKQVYMTESH